MYFMNLFQLLQNTVSQSIRESTSKIAIQRRGASTNQDHIFKNIVKIDFLTNSKDLQISLNLTKVIHKKLYFLTEFSSTTRSKITQNEKKIYGSAIRIISLPENSCRNIFLQSKREPNKIFFKISKFSIFCQLCDFLNCRFLAQSLIIFYWSNLSFQGKKSQVTVMTWFYRLPNKYHKTCQMSA